MRKIFELPLLNTDAYKSLSDTFDTKGFDGWNPKNTEIVLFCYSSMILLFLYELFNISL